MDTPSARERRLAQELKVWRASVPLHGKDVAARLGWSASKVSRIEASRTGIGEHDLELLLELYGVPPEQAARLRALAPAARPRGWWDAYADTLSSGYASLIRMEAGSRALSCYCAVVPHALLQTPDYVRQVVRTTWRQPPAVEVDRRVEVCRRRQGALDRGDLHLSAVIDESVLRRVPAGPGGAAVLRGQLEHLVAASAHPHVTLRVLPFTAGLPPVTAGSFSVLESAATGAADVVYLENKTRIFVIEKEAEVHGYTREFGLLTELALPPDDSLDLVRRAADGLT